MSSLFKGWDGAATSLSQWLQHANSAGVVIVMIYHSLRSKCTVLSINDMIKYLLEGGGWKYDPGDWEAMWSFQPHHCQRDHYLNDHLTLPWEGLGKERLSCRLAVLLKNIFHPRLKLSFTPWNFCDFKDAQQHVFFCPSRASWFKLPCLHDKGEPIKTLQCIFIAHHPFSKPTHPPYISVWAWL